MKIPEDAIFRILVQTREGDKWKGKDWIYLNAGQAKQALISLLTSGISNVFAELFKPGVESITRTLFGERR